MNMQYLYGLHLLPRQLHLRLKCHVTEAKLLAIMTPLFLLEIFTVLSVFPYSVAPFPIPTPRTVACGLQCHCVDRTLSCTGTQLRHLAEIPLVKHQDQALFLDFRNNHISRIQKSTWLFYSFAESLILKNNLITQLDEDSFEGLLFLKVLDLSMNKIEMVAPHVFQPLPFLQSLNLAGNAIHEIHSGTFETWHGLLLLTSVVLAHNPLESFNDKALYNLGSMTYLDVGATNIPVPAIKTLLKTLPGLTTIILPNSVTCCLCLAQKKNTIRPETVKLHCLKTCPVNTFQCKLNTVLRKFLNSLRVHQINRTVTLTIESERPLTRSIEAKDFTDKRAENMHPLIQVNFPDKDNVLQATISSNYWENQGIMEISIPVYITVGVILIVMCFLLICWKRSTTQKKKPASNDDSEEDSCSQRVCISALYGCEWAEQQAEVERLRELSRRQK